MVWQQLDLSESQYVGIQATEGEESQDRRGLHPGSRAGKEKKFCGSVCCSLEQPCHRQKGCSKGDLKTHGGTGWHQQWHMGTAQGVCVWVGHGWLKQPGLSLCKASCASTASKV